MHVGANLWYVYSTRSLMLGPKVTNIECREKHLSGVYRTTIKNTIV